MENRIALMSVIAGIALVGGLFLGASSIPVFDQDSNTIESSTGFLGHVTLTVYGPDGNIKHYLQGDNIVQDDGENCIAELVTGLTTFGCAGTNLPFTTIAIGTSADTGDETTGALLATVKTQVGTPVLNAAASGGSAAIFDVVASFSDPGANTYAEAGLFDTSSNMLARENFTTGATLGSSDDLVITWTITIGA